MTAATDHRRRQRTGAVWRLTAVAFAVALAATACGRGSDDSNDSLTDSPAATMAASADMADDMMMAESEEMAEEEATAVRMTQGAAAEEEMLEDSDSGALAGGTATAPADLGRDIIYEAWISVEAVDVAAAAAEATNVVQSLGGITFGQQTSTRDHVYTTLTFKIRPAHFPEALKRLSAVGELVDQSVTAEDVTDIVVDLNSRVATAEVSVDRLRDFLSRATDVEGVAELERELAQRETNLERLRGQLRSLRDRVDLATITLTISEATEAVPETSVLLRAWLAAGPDDPCLGFKDLFAPPEGDIGFCFELENDGETTLTDITLSSDSLRFGMNELVLPAGTDLERIEPGERVVATLTEEVSDGRIAGRVATRGLNIDVRVRALPIADDGSEFASLARVVTLDLYVQEDDSPPSFGDALRGGWDALVAVGNGVLLVIGALLPFLPVIAIALVVAWWWLRRRRTRRAVTAGSSDET